MPSVSVIIPTYNHRDYVGASLDSVFAQSLADYEVIVVNDGSPDDTAEVLRRHEGFGRIRYVEQANAGQAAARNRGLAEATGEFIAFLDDDDLWPADKLAWQVELLGRNDWSAVAGTAGFIEGAAVSLPPQSDSVRLFRPADLLPCNWIHSPGQALIRRTAVESIGGFDPKLWGSDDYDLWLRLSAVRPVAYCDRVALLYRRHASNASHASERMFWNVLRTIRKNKHLVPRPQRGGAVRQSYRWLYSFAHPVLVKAKREPSAGSAVAAVRVLRGLAPLMARDRFLLAAVTRELTPAWFYATYRRLRPSRART